MKIFISGEIDDTVGYSFSKIAFKDIGAKLKVLIDRSYGSEVTNIGIIPVIVRPSAIAAGFWKERRLFQRKQNSADYRLRIDFIKFLNSDNKTRRLLIIKNIIDSIRDLGRKAKKDFDAKSLEKDILDILGVSYSDLDNMGRTGDLSPTLPKTTEEIKIIKLYKIRLPGDRWYHEAWIDGDTIVEHCGALGDRGSTREHKRLPDLSEKDNLIAILDSVMTDGFRPIAAEDHKTLMIEYAVDGFGTSADLDKRLALEKRMDGTLGWTGLGHSSGGNIGSRTMEVHCSVVDCQLAQKVIQEDLQDTQFADYARIYCYDSPAIAYDGENHASWCGSCA